MPIALRELLILVHLFFKKESYLIYLWEVLEWHCLLLSLMQTLQMQQSQMDNLCVEYTESSKHDPFISKIT